MEHTSHCERAVCQILLVERLKVKNEIQGSTNSQNLEIIIRFRIQIFCKQRNGLSKAYYILKRLN